LCAAVSRARLVAAKWPRWIAARDAAEAKKALGNELASVLLSARSVMRKSIQTILGSATVALVIAGCGGGNSEPSKTPDTTPASSTPPSAMDAGTTMLTPPATPTPVSASSNDMASTERMPSDSSATPPTDEQILTIVHVANQGEIEQAKLAQSKAKDPRVKKLAAMMQKDHSAADGKDLSIVKRNHLDLSPSKASTDLESGANDNTQMLKGASGADFDKSYVDTQVKEHQEVLDTIDQKLVPNAKNSELRTYLAEVRTKVAMHLQHAKDLQAELTK
jgi:putative membrane protein